jgi:hypothetical protein
MKNLILVDTSAWICANYRTGFKTIKNIIALGLEENLIAITDIIRLELLVGIRKESEFIDLQDKLNALHQLEMNSPIWRGSERLGFHLQRKGIRIPTTDILIATVARYYQCSLLHQDKHFEVIANHSSLKVVNINQD